MNVPSPDSAAARTALSPAARHSHCRLRQRRVQRGRLRRLEVGRGGAPALRHLQKRAARLEVRDDAAKLSEPAFVVDDAPRRVRDSRRTPRAALHLRGDLPHQLQPGHVEPDADVGEGHDPRPARAGALFGERLEPAHTRKEEGFQERVRLQQREDRGARSDQDVLRTPDAHRRRHLLRLPGPGKGSRATASRARCPSGAPGVSCRSRPVPRSRRPRHEHRHLQQRREVLRRAAPVHDRVLLRRRARPRRARGTQRHRQDDPAAPRLRRRARRLRDDRPRSRPQDLAPRADPGARARPPGARLPPRGVRRDRRARGRAARHRGAALRPRRAQPRAARHDEELPAAPAALRGRRRLRLPRPPRRRRRGPRAPRRHAGARPALAVRRRAHARHPGAGAARRRRPAAARRAHQPPRHRLGGVARGRSSPTTSAPSCW